MFSVPLYGIGDLFAFIFFLLQKTKNLVGVFHSLITIGLPDLSHEKNENEPKF